MAIDMQIHSFTDLFDQMGLPSDESSINSFLNAHAPLADNIRLANAPFWSASQAAFLREKILEDSEWAVVVDQLNTALRAIKE